MNVRQTDLEKELSCRCIMTVFKCQMSTGADGLVVKWYAVF